MHEIEILLVSILVAFAQGSNSSQFTNWQSSWIINGVKADIKEYPYMVRLRNNADGVHICGGTIISSWYALTAAHCIAGRGESSFKVVVGSDFSKPGNRYGVSEIITHPLYNPSQYINDIGLVKVLTPFNFKSTVQPVTLALRAHRAALTLPCVITGWGTTRRGAPRYVKTLHKLKSKIIPLDECQNQYPHVTDAYICTRSSSIATTSQGDEGGPLICNGKQVGVFSTRETRFVTRGVVYPALFMYVPKYRDWIYMVTSRSVN